MTNAQYASHCSKNGKCYNIKYFTLYVVWVQAVKSKSKMFFLFLLSISSKTCISALSVLNKEYRLLNCLHFYVILVKYCNSLLSAGLLISFLTLPQSFAGLYCLGCIQQQFSSLQPTRIKIKETPISVKRKETPISLKMRWLKKKSFNGLH